VYNVRLRRVGLPIVAGTKQKELNILFLALFIQHAKGMDHIVLWSVPCPNLSYFSKLPHKQHDFLEQVFEHEIHI